MAITASVSSKDFKPAPEGLHRAICVDVVDLGMVDVEYKGQKKRKHKVKISWQIEELMEDGRPFIVSQRFNLSLHKKSTLRPILESWRGRRFTDEELKGFDLEKLLGANCQINVTHNISDGETYANVTAVVPAIKGLPPLRGNNYIRMCDREGYEPPPSDEPEPSPEYSDGAETEEEVPF